MKFTPFLQNSGIIIALPDMFVKKTETSGVL